MTCFLLKIIGVKMKFIDLHCDTLMQAYQNQKKSIYETEGMLDLKRMKEAGQLAQFFAIFMPSINSSLYQEANYKDETYIEYCLDAFNTSIKQSNDIIERATNIKELTENEKKGKMSAFLTFEDARVINSDLDKLKYYYDKGIRLITLTWNHENCMGYPNSRDKNVMKKGLKPFGKEAVEYMNELGIIIDTSHLSDGGFYDLINISKKPFIASHSNARELTKHPRNLSDDMLIALANKGGLVGINFEPSFLKDEENGVSNRESKLEYIIKHIKHIRNVAGIDVLALGSDFDGIAGKFEVSNPLEVNLIFEELRKNNFSNEDIEKIAYKNSLRLIKELL